MGPPSTPTIVTHLMLGPTGHENGVGIHEHEHLAPAENARECAYDHAHQLIEAQRFAGREASIRLDELSFVELERVE